MVKNRIAALRKEDGMNQKELGLKLGVGQTTVSAWETGKNEPDTESLHRMSKLFRASIGYILGYENGIHRGLSPEEYELDELRRDVANETTVDPSGLTPAEIAEFEHDYDMEAWEESGRADTIEGFLASRIIDEQPAEVRKWLLDGIKHFTNKP